MGGIGVNIHLLRDFQNNICVLAYCVRGGWAMNWVKTFQFCEFGVNLLFFTKLKGF